MGISAYYYYYYLKKNKKQWVYIFLDQSQTHGLLFIPEYTRPYTHKLGEQKATDNGQRVKEKPTYRD